MPNVKRDLALRSADANPTGGVGVLSTSRYKRLDTELAEDTWIDPRLWSQLNTSLLCLSQENTLPPSLIVSVQICYSCPVLCPTTSLCPPLVSRPSSSGYSLTLCSSETLGCLSCTLSSRIDRKGGAFDCFGPKMSTSCPWQKITPNQWICWTVEKTEKNPCWINPGTISGKTFKPN